MQQTGSLRQPSLAASYRGKRKPRSISLGGRAETKYLLLGGRAEKKVSAKRVQIREDFVVFSCRRVEKLSERGPFGDNWQREKSSTLAWSS